MELLKPLKDLTLLDRFLFSEVMEDPVNLETVLEIILGREVLLRYLPQAEKEQKRSPLYRYVRLDVWGEDDHGVFDVEVQKKDTRNLPKRSRFYQGMMDIKLLKPGEVDFNRMKNCCIITITPFDLFGKKRYQYTFRMRCDEDTQIALEDGAVRIFLNTHGVNVKETNPELTELLHFIEHTNDQPKGGYQSGRIQDLKDRIEKIKHSEEIGVKYMQAWEEIELAKIEGRQEGERGKLKELIKKKLNKGKAVVQIAEELEEETDTVAELIGEINAGK